MAKKIKQLKPIQAHELVQMIAELGDLTKTSLLKYQKEFYQDQSRLVLWSKSRQIGGTWTASYKVVQDAAKSDFPYTTYWISKDEDLAREFILYCLAWMKCYNELSILMASVKIIQLDRDCMAFQILLPNGCRIRALSSKTSATVGRHGNIWIDEMAVHDNQEALYAFAKPCILWGYKFYVISTSRGEDSVFEKLRNDPKYGFSVHTTTIVDAIEDGIVEKINVNNIRMGLPELTDDQFLKQIKDECITIDDFLQEFMCVPRGNRDSWLEWNWIQRAKTDDAELEADHDGKHWLGMDVGKVKDPSYIVIYEEFASLFFLKYLWTGKCKDYDEIWAQFLKAMRQFYIFHACIDANGVGERIAAPAIQKFGEHRITGVESTNATNEHMAGLMYEKFGKYKMRIPHYDPYCLDLFSVKEIVLGSGKRRYEAPRKYNKAHADGFMATGMCLLAAETETGPQGGTRVERLEEEREYDDLFDEMESIGKISHMDLL